MKEQRIISYSQKLNSSYGNKEDYQEHDIVKQLNEEGWMVKQITTTYPLITHGGANQEGAYSDVSTNKFLVLVTLLLERI